MKHSESFAKLAGALVKVQGQLESVTKDRTNPHFKNRYATLDAITDYVRPILATHGLAVVQGANEPILTSGGMVAALDVVTMLIHESGEWLSTSVSVPVDKSNAQGAGSAVTYGRRYGLAAMLAVTTDEDDDGNNASKKAAPAKPAESRSQRVPPPGPVSAPDPEDFVCQFEPIKGTNIRAMTTDRLEKAVQWAVENKKELGFQAAAKLALAARAKKATTVPE